MLNALVLESGLLNEVEWVVVGVDCDNLRMAEKVVLEPLQSHHQSQSFPLDGGVRHLVDSERSNRLPDGEHRSLHCTDVGRSDTHSTGIHGQVEGQVLVWHIENRGRGEEGLEAFEGFMSHQRPLKGPLDTSERGQRCCYHGEVGAESPVVITHTEEPHYLPTTLQNREV